MRAFQIVLIAMFILLVSVVASVLTAPEQEDRYTALHLVGEPSQQGVSFTVQNQEAARMTYTYEVYVTEHTGERLKCSGQVEVPQGLSTYTSIPLDAPRAERIRVRLVETGQEVSYYTNYTYQEWRPQYDRDIPWDRQDPLVKHFYRYVPETSKSSDQRR
jgi:hypothetical protein